MDESIQDGQEVHETPEVVEVPKAELDELRKKADASSQNFARLKKLEEEMKSKEGTLPTETKVFDSASLERKIEEKVTLRMKGYDPEHIQEIERYARGAGFDSLLEAEKSPFVQKGLAALQAEKKSEESTPAPSSRVRLVNGKPASDILKDKDAAPADKQAAFEARMKRA